MTVGPIVAFLEGDQPDACGRTVFDLLRLDDAAIEGTHDFIQWLFPLPEPSGAVPGSPVLSSSDIEAIRESGMAQCALSAATRRMEAFYCTSGGWLTPHDHNHLRITRIIRSLRLLRGDAEADAFRDVILSLIEAARAPVSARSRGYWATA